MVWLFLALKKKKSSIKKSSIPLNKSEMTAVVNSVYSLTHEEINNGVLIQLLSHRPIERTGGRVASVCIVIIATSLDAVGLGFIYRLGLPETLKLAI